MVNRLLTSGIHFQPFFHDRPGEERGLHRDLCFFEYYRGSVKLFHIQFEYFTRSGLPVQA